MAMLVGFVHLRVDPRVIPRVGVDERVSVRRRLFLRFRRLLSFCNIVKRGL